MTLHLSNDVIIIRVLQKIPREKLIIPVLPNKFPWKFVIFVVTVLRGSVVA